MVADAVVVGGGLAGLAAAFDLAEAGRRVTLVEGRDVLGGRTSSWVEDGMPVESGLHRWLGVYVELPGFLRRAGIDPDDILFWEDEIEIRMPDGGPSGVFGLAPVFKPLKTVAGAVGNNDLISPAEKARLAKWGAAGLFELARRPAALDRMTVHEHALSQGLDEDLIERVLRPACAGTFFLSPEEWSAYNLFQLIAQGLVRGPKSRIGAFLGGMTDVMARPLGDAVVERGGEVRTGFAVEHLITAGGEVIGVASADEEIAAGEVILATSLAPAQRLIAEAFPGRAEFRSMLALESMPSVTIQFELEEPATPVDRTTFTGRTILAGFAEQSRSTFRHAAGRLSVILAPPQRFLDMPHDEICAATVRDGLRLGLPMDKVTRYRVVTLREDFYSLAPGNEALRPAQETPVAGLTLAGDYTRQEWLASMEGAVISGRRAAALVAGRLG